jgi:hypothetical protein
LLLPSRARRRQLSARLAAGLRPERASRINYRDACFSTDATDVIGVVQTGGDQVLAASPAAYYRTPDCGDDFDGRR